MGERLKGKVAVVTGAGRPRVYPHLPTERSRRSRSTLLQQLWATRNLRATQRLSTIVVQGERKGPMKSGRGSVHAERVEALGGVFQQPVRG